jgi:hypothetical protein
VRQSFGTSHLPYIGGLERLKAGVRGPDPANMPIAPPSVRDPVAEAIAATLTRYQHLAACAPCHDYLVEVAGLASVDVICSAVLAFHYDSHRRDPRSVAIDFFATF